MLLFCRSWLFVLRLLFFVLHSLLFVFCLLLFIHRLSLFFCRFLFHVCLWTLYFCRLFFLFCLFPFFVYNKYSFFAGNLRKWKTFRFCKIKGIACLEKKKICKSEYFAFCVEVKVFYFGKLWKILGEKSFLFREIISLFCGSHVVRKLYLCKRKGMRKARRDNANC